MLQYRYNKNRYQSELQQLHEQNTADMHACFLLASYWMSIIREVIKVYVKKRNEIIYNNFVNKFPLILKHCIGNFGNEINMYNQSCINVFLYNRFVTMINLNLEMCRANLPHRRMYENSLFRTICTSVAHSYAILDLQSRSVALKSRSLVNSSHSLQS